MEPLAFYLGTPLAYDVAGLSEKLSGGAARLEHEQKQGMEFWACPDLSPREKAAAHLLAVVSNHRAISWWRAPDTPDGTDPLPALESWQEERLCKDTIDAAHAYAAFLPEREADALVALAPKPQQTAQVPDTALELTAKPETVADVAKPWLQVDPRDPNPEQHWYTPARYFARQLVIADTTLLTKKLMLADKVSSSLAGVGIFKRGGKKPPKPDTVLKAFANVPWG
jgi:hypothetical protein